MNKSLCPWVYIFQTECGKYQKFGRTRLEPKFRLSQVQGGCPIKLELVFCIKTEIASEIEQDIFVHFSNQRTIGEWFSLSADQLSAAIVIIQERANKHG